MFYRAAAGQVELDAVFVLDDPHRELEQLHDDRGGLGLGQFGMDEHFSAQGLMQDIGGTGEEQAHVVGEETVIGGAVTGEIVFDHLDEVFILPAGTIEIPIQVLGGGQTEGGDHIAGILTE